MVHNEISKAILQHLTENPDAGDTLEGITEWWIRKTIINMKVNEVLGAIEELRQENILMEREMTGTTMYFLNIEKLAEIRRLLSNEM